MCPHHKIYGLQSTITRWHNSQAGNRAFCFADPAHTRKILSLYTSSLSESRFFLALRQKAWGWASSARVRQVQDTSHIHRPDRPPVEPFVCCLPHCFQSRLARKRCVTLSPWRGPPLFRVDSRSEVYRTLRYQFSAC